MQMPPLDPDILRRRGAIVAALQAIVPGEGVIDDLDGMRPYECDALSAYRQMPLVVVLPETVDQVAAILRYCQDHKVKVVPRGAGTSLSGGSMPVGDAILLGMAKFNRVLEIDYANRCARVQPGVTNLGVTKAVEHEGFYYAPDPSSQIACSIGGNVAENSGGVHCLKYGLTTNNLLGIEMVLMNGEVVRLGGKHLDLGRLRPAGPDDRLRGSARRRHRSDRAPAAQALDGACRAARLPDRSGRGRLRRGRHRLGHHPRRHGDDGQGRRPVRRELCRRAAIRSMPRAC